MHINRLNVIFLDLIIHFTSVSTASTQLKYVNIEDPLTLQCTVNNYTRASWGGPCLRTTSCNTKTYFDGLNRNPDLPNIITLQKSEDEKGQYDLKISMVNLENEGWYTCADNKDMSVKTKTFQVIIKEKPSNLVIKNMTSDGRIVGIEGVTLDLVCTVTSGVPLENMTWYNDESIVKVGGPGMIRYSFVPTQADNGRNLKCVVQSDALKMPLERNVQLDIQDRPVVECVDESISVVEGDNLTVQCLAHSNPPPTDVRITRHGENLKQCPQSPCSLKQKSSRNDSGIYWCTAQNQIGNGSNCHTNVTILYPPDVSVVLLNDTTLQCRATGEPNNVTYLSWQYNNELGEVRYFKGSEYLQLCSSCKRYMVNGLYRCNATNGIRHNDGNTISFGNVSLQIKGIPEILPKTKTIQYGKYRKSVSLEIFVYSTAMLTIERILRNGDVIESSEGLETNDSFRNQYKVTYHIAVLQAEDFAQYTFHVKNDEGAMNFTVSLEAKDIPEVPVIQRLTVTDSDVTVHFDDTFDGGVPQVYVLQYRSILKWTGVEVKDTFDGVCSYTIQNLEVGQKYFFRIYSVNSVGQSDFSEVWSIELTGGLNPHVLPYVVIATGIVVLLFFTTLISRKVEAIKTRLARSDNNGENDSVQDQPGQNVDVLVENQLYLAFDSISRNQQQIANVNRPTHVDAQSHGDNSMQNRNLHYADLEFNPASQRFFIRGDDRTIYSEIDHSLVAPPLESSDSEEEDKKNEDEDVFMTVEEIAEFMRERGMKPPLDDD